MAYDQHESAIIDEGAVIGAGSRVWHFAHICAGARIGSRCSIGQNVFVGNDVAVGDDCKIQNNVSLYDGVRIADGVFCGPSMVFTNVYNPRSLIARRDEYRQTVVRRGATLGANCTIICGTTIGEFAFIAAGAVINRDVPDFALMAGVPARRIGWMSIFGEQLKFGDDGIAICPHTGDRFHLAGDLVTREESQSELASSALTKVIGVL